MSDSGGLWCWWSVRDAGCTNSQWWPVVLTGTGGGLPIMLVCGTGSQWWSVVVSGSGHALEAC